MQKTLLVLNAGSSSVKFAVARGGKIFLRGGIDHLGRRAGVRLIAGRRTTYRTASIPNLRAAFSVVKAMLARSEIIPTEVAHRIVHGGQRYSKPTLLTPAALSYLYSLIELAPLHQPVNLMGVEFSKKMWSEAAEWGVFDTAIYRALPVRVRTYALPPNLTKRLHIEKYGFHGLSHGWAFRQAALKLRMTPHTLSAVTLHLGAGASMTLWRRGRPADTTMGFTPLEGLVMSTRSGDIDPAIPLYIQKRLGWSARRVGHLLEEHAGMIGLSGLRDMRDVLEAAGHHVHDWPDGRWNAVTKRRARRALEIFVYHVRRTLAAYLGLYGGVRAVVFTGPVGENRTIQHMILRDLPAARGMKVVTVHADEEQAIVDAVDA